MKKGQWRKCLVFSVLCFVGSVGCVKMRDYTYRENGSCGLRVKQEMGEGYQEGRDYYSANDGLYFIVRDTKDEIVKKMGLPDKREKTVEGYDCWVYKSRKLMLFFKDDYLESWEEI
ncbi:MAG: hypothetical protein ABIH71_03245 [Candidatus Omnitrophota bacterium]|nr:hypothetical protein [Candidatus Omnitrophota bacterium]